MTGLTHGLHHVEEPIQLGLRDRRIVFRPREVGPHATKSEPSPRDQVHERRCIFGGPDPRTVHAGVHLDVHVYRGADPSAAAASRSNPARVESDRGEPGAEGNPLRAGGQLRQHQDRSVDAVSSQAQPLFDERHAEPGRPRVQTRAPPRDVTVTVRIGLHDGHELGAVRSQHANVVRDRVEVDLDVCGPEGSGIAGHRWATPSIASGRCDAMSPAMVPSPSVRPARYPASPWT